MRYSLAQRPPVPTVRILMLATKLGAPDGITTIQYEAGKEYDVPEDLAASFFSCGAADSAEAHEVANAAEQTHADPAPIQRRRRKT